MLIINSDKALKGIVNIDNKYQIILYPYTAERRDVLGNTIPEDREISQGPRAAQWKSYGPRGMCVPEAQKPKTFRIAAFYAQNFPDEARGYISRSELKPSGQN